MLLQIKNWKLILLALIMIGILTRLGFWQLSRAEQKQHMLDQYHLRMNLPAINAEKLHQTGEWQYYRIRLTGYFDNAHTLLLDNKIFKGAVGYEIFTPFHADGFSQPILIDRGFMPIRENRNHLPDIKPVNGTTTITGMINHPPGYVKFGQMIVSDNISWPLRIEYLNIDTINSLMKITFYPYIISLTPSDSAAYPIEWQIIGMNPERHLGYAVQWFALALTLLILSVALNRNPQK